MSDPTNPTLERVLSAWRAHQRIQLALKQNGMRQGDAVALDAVWGGWRRAAPPDP